jgi:hypothetical protein
VRPGPGVLAWAIASAGLSPVLLAGAWLIADTVQPASYSPVRQTVSVLAGQGGTDRWIMTSALLAVGGCQLVTAAGLTTVQVPARVLLIVGGLASFGIAASPEPAGGSTPQHLAWTALGAVVISVWPAFTARRAARPLIVSVPGAAAVTGVFAVLLGWLILETQGGADLGLAERLSSVIQTSWPFIVALALQRSALRAARHGDEQAAGAALEPAPVRRASGRGSLPQPGHAGARIRGTAPGYRQDADELGRPTLG